MSVESSKQSAESRTGELPEHLKRHVRSSQEDLEFSANSQGEQGLV